ncbi:unnamed protein product [Toxocara canis]|uniref:PPIase cyclophilin-type domain-containing protein n=1 Tax=Toxocara canis TaxID=6265 RepID=A0A183U6R5_TOXCA|nr:unnamed protein product [Toxocara canis]
MAVPVRVFLDLTADGRQLGRLIFELRKDICPKTTENFRVLCTGEKGFGYKGCIFYRIIPGFCACVSLLKYYLAFDTLLLF